MPFQFFSSASGSLEFAIAFFLLPMRYAMTKLRQIYGRTAAHEYRPQKINHGYFCVKVHAAVQFELKDQTV
jgi:hypothetical protein